MNFADSILKTDVARYVLQNATISGGQLHLFPGGSAQTNITSLDLSKLTEYFQVIYQANVFCDPYKSNIRIYIQAVTLEGKTYNVTCLPVETQTGFYIQEFQLEESEYTSFTWKIESDIDVTISIWELRPEASDVDIQTIIDGVEQSLPRLLYDYNTTVYTVQQQETTVGVITCRLIGDTDLQGHFTITFMASQASTVTVRFYDNGAEELFSPLYYDVNVGHNTIGIPHAYLQRKIGLHSFVVTLQVEIGELTIDVRNILFTVDGGYLARREIDAALDIQDIAVRQLALSQGPDEIWALGLDENNLLVRKRNYKEENANVGWTPVGSLGEGLTGAIEFNGVWTLRPGEGKFTIITEEEPYIFVVTLTNDLLAYHGINDESPVLLDTNVTMVKACRGFSSIEYPDQDQGLVVAYIKTDKTAWYKQLYQSVWLPSEQIGTELWDFINVSRLNDYRLSFQLTNAEKNLWIYTDQTWVGQATPPEIWNTGRSMDNYSMWVGTQDALNNYRTTFIEDPTYTYVYKSDENKYYWTIFFHIAYPLLFRMDVNILDYVQLSGTLYNNVIEKRWNEQTNTIEIVVKMDYTPETIPIASGTLTLNILDGLIVFPCPEGYMLISNVNKILEIDNINRYNYEIASEEFSLGTDITLNPLVYLKNTFTTVEIPFAFTLGTGTHTFTYGKVIKTTIVPEEDITLGVDETLNRLSYSGTYVKPI